MSKYRKGRVVSGTVTGIEKYGIFVSLDENYNGLIHISEVSRDFVKNIYDIVDIGDIIYARVIGVDDNDFHIKLSIKDVDYKNARKKRHKIVETKSGFKPLAEHLDSWIEEKIKEIEKN